MSLKMPAVKLGFMPLLDAAPLIAAQELGLYSSEGVTVDLVRESSWATLRDKLAFGMLDGAHLLAPIPFASTLGIGSVKKPMLTALSLGLNGNAITLSKALSAALHDTQSRPTPTQLAQRLAVLIRDGGLGQRPITLAIVHPHSMHHFLLRAWLLSGGINPDQDVNIVVVPPPMMVNALAQADIDGFCVGEPYNGLAQRRGLGDIVLTGFDIFPNAPEKVFGVTQHWANEHPDVHLRLLRALIQACQWLDQPDNHSALAEMLSRPEYVGLDTDTLHSAVQQMSHAQGPALPATHKTFYRAGATVPSPEHGQWIVQQLQALSAESPAIPPQVVTDVYRIDLYQQALASLDDRA